MHMLMTEIQSKIVREHQFHVVQYSHKDEEGRRLYKVSRDYERIEDSTDDVEYHRILLDANSANILCTVYNALSDENKKKWDQVHVLKLVDFAMSVIK